MTLADTQAAAFLVRRAPATIRDWGRDKRITRHGTDARRRALWCLEEVQAVDEQMRHAS